MENGKWKMETVKNFRKNKVAILLLIFFTFFLVFYFSLFLVPLSRFTRKSIF